REETLRQIGIQSERQKRREKILAEYLIRFRCHIAGHGQVQIAAQTRLIFRRASGESRKDCGAETTAGDAADREGMLSKGGAPVLDRGEDQRRIISGP